MKIKQDWLSKLLNEAEMCKQQRECDTREARAGCSPGPGQGEEVRAAVRRCTHSVPRSPRSGNCLWCSWWTAGPWPRSGSSGATAGVRDRNERQARTQKNPKWHNCQLHEQQTTDQGRVNTAKEPQGLICLSRNSDRLASPGLLGSPFPSNRGKLSLRISSKPHCRFAAWDKWDKNIILQDQFPLLMCVLVLMKTKGRFAQEAGTSSCKGQISPGGSCLNAPHDDLPMTSAWGDSPEVQAGQLYPTKLPWGLPEVWFKQDL